jgi:hypothetical protein
MSDLQRDVTQALLPSLCSQSTAPTRRMMASRLGEDPDSVGAVADL